MRLKKSIGDKSAAKRQLCHHSTDTLTVRLAVDLSEAKVFLGHNDRSWERLHLVVNTAWTQWKIV